MSDAEKASATAEALQQAEARNRALEERLEEEINKRHAEADAKKKQEDAEKAEAGLMEKITGAVSAQMQGWVAGEE